jgi:hypothetical protein
MDVKDMAMAQLTETQQMSRGIDVIASYYKVRGAEIARGAAKGLGGESFKDFRAAVDEFSVRKSSEGKGTLESTAEYMASHKLETLGNLAKKGVNKVKSYFTGKNEDETQTPAPPTETTVNHNVSVKVDNLAGPITKHILTNPDIMDWMSNKDERSYTSQ